LLKLGLSTKVHLRKVCANHILQTGSKIKNVLFYKMEGTGSPEEERMTDSTQKASTNRKRKGRGTEEDRKTEEKAKKEERKRKGRGPEEEREESKRKGSRAERK
jgi:hypothetical protein